MIAGMTDAHAAPVHVVHVTVRRALVRAVTVPLRARRTVGLTDVMTGGLVPFLLPRGIPATDIDDGAQDNQAQDHPRRYGGDDLFRRELAAYGIPAFGKIVLARLAGHLLGAGVKPGQRNSVVMHNLSARG